MNQDRDSWDGGYHRPVLADEVATLLAPVMPGVVIDATFGGGGHSRRLLDEFGMKKTDTRWVQAWSMQKPPRRKPQPSKE